jgi:hypothetical protein
MDEKLIKECFMKNTMKKGFLFLVLAVLAAGAVFAQNRVNDNWSNVTRINQLNGTWKGVTSSTLTMREFMESQGVKWTSDIQQFYGNMNVKIDLDLAISINAGRQTGSIKGNEIFTFSGGNINNTWSALRDALSGEDAVANDRNRSITVAIDVPDSSMTESEIKEYKINQNGRRISVPFSNLGLSYLPEYFVFTKQ